MERNYYGSYNYLQSRFGVVEVLAASNVELDGTYEE